jgi:hypothetical protein
MFAAGEAASGVAFMAPMMPAIGKLSGTGTVKSTKWEQFGWAQRNSETNLFSLNSPSVSLAKGADPQGMVVEFAGAPNSYLAQAPGDGRGWYSEPAPGLNGGVDLVVWLLDENQINIAGAKFEVPVIPVRCADRGQNFVSHQTFLSASYFEAAAFVRVTDRGTKKEGNKC